MYTEAVQKLQHAMIRDGSRLHHQIQASADRTRPGPPGSIVSLQKRLFESIYLYTAHCMINTSPHSSPRLFLSNTVSHRLPGAAYIKPSTLLRPARRYNPRPWNSKPTETDIMLDCSLSLNVGAPALRPSNIPRMCSVVVVSRRGRIIDTNREFAHFPPNMSFLLF